MKKIFETVLKIDQVWKIVDKFPKKYQRKCKQKQNSKMKKLEHVTDLH